MALAQLLVEQNFPAIAIHRAMTQEERYELVLTKMVWWSVLYYQNNILRRNFYLEFGKIIYIDLNKILPISRMKYNVDCEI